MGMGLCIYWYDFLHFASKFIKDRRPVFVVKCHHFQRRGGYIGIFDAEGILKLCEKAQCIYRENAVFIANDILRSIAPINAFNK